MRKITKCPHCGSDRGMYVKFKACGTDTYRYDGKMESSEVTSYYDFNKNMRCCDCGKKVMSYEEYERGYLLED